MAYDYNRTRTATTAVAPFRFVKAASQATPAGQLAPPLQCAQAAGPTDPIIGVSLQFTNAAAGDRAEFAVFGPGKVQVGATAVNDGDLLTSDANGCAATAVPHTHVENEAAAYAQNATTGPAALVRVAAMAIEPGNPGDVIEIVLVPQHV